MPGSLRYRAFITSCLIIVLCAALVLLSACRAPDTQPVHIAVAANFTEPAKEIAERFHEETGHKTLMSFGATGQLFTQIPQDAPFEVFLAADQETPRKAVTEGLAVEDSLFTYAVGRIALYSSSLDVSNGEMVLRDGKFEKLSIANPLTAPYGAAAIEAMKALGLYEKLEKKIVQGNNIAQTFQFVETGSAELGFVALSQVVGRNRNSVWIVPDTLYSAIRQDAVLINKSAGHDGARAFMTFLRGEQALRIMEKYGYARSSERLE